MDVIRWNQVLCRTKLDICENQNEVGIYAFEDFEDMEWFRVDGLTKFWEDSKRADFNSVFSDILSSVVIAGSPFAFLLLGDKKGINFYIGSDKELIDGISETYRSCMPGIDIKSGIFYHKLLLPVQYGGLLTGYPVDKGQEERGKTVLQIDNICRGMQGNNFAILIVGSRLQPLLGNSATNEVDNLLKACSMEMSKSINIESAMGQDTKQVTNFDVQRFSQNLEKLNHFLEQGNACGLWSVCGYYMSDNRFASEKLKGMLKAAYGGVDEESFETFRCLKLSGGMDFLKKGVGLIWNRDSDALSHPLGFVYSQVHNTKIPFYEYMYQTIMTSNQLAVLCKFPKTEFAGFYIDKHVEFDTSMRRKHETALRVGEVTVSGRNADSVLDNEYAIDLMDMTRHALIIGITGGGKTNTSKALLSQLWLIHNTPFLVIESAKREYWELMNLRTESIRNTAGKHINRSYQDLTVYTLGSEEPGKSVRFRINPFELVGEEVSVQTHIDYLLSTFKASFELYAPMPYVLEAAVYEVYSDRGWDIVENRNIYGLKDYPTLTDLYYKIDVVTNRLKYNAEVQSNVKAALKARINSLRIGGKGAMLDTQRSVPVSELLNTPTILELEDLGDDDTKAFVIGILLVQLYEYRKSQTTGGQHELKHVLMIEEAHRLLKYVSPATEGGGAKGKSVEFFCNMLAEIRSFGQGIVVADQIPTKLAQDTIKNTNLKIVHRTVMKEDREAVGFAMNMSLEQIDYLSSLPRGRAAVYAEGDNMPKLVKIDFIQEIQEKLTRKQVLEIVRRRLAEKLTDYDVRYEIHKGCMMCERRCDYYNEIVTLRKMMPISTVIKQMEERGINVRMLYSYVQHLEQQAGRSLEVFEAICAAGDLLTQMSLSEEIQAEHIVRFAGALYKKHLLDEQ